MSSRFIVYGSYIGTIQRKLNQPYPDPPQFQNPERIQHSPCQQAFCAVGALPQGAVMPLLSRSVILMELCQQMGHFDLDLRQENLKSGSRATITLT
jgi:hypothetical protein